MKDNPIPEELRSDHLFLLVGTNPLPDWVATKLLLREGGQLYLVHSGNTSEVARRIADFARDNNLREPNNKWQEPTPIQVKDPFRSDDVRQAIDHHLKKITSGSIGLNYTGGTKVMSVHGYRTLFERHTYNVVFSYLEVGRSTMRFEPLSPYYPQGHQCEVGLIKGVEFSFVKLFNLHGEFHRLNLETDFKAIPVAELLLDVHCDQKNQSAWKLAWLNVKRSRGDWGMRPLNFTPQYSGIAEALIKDGSGGTKTFSDVVQHSGLGFQEESELVEWLDGKWLEHYVFACLKKRQVDYRVNDLGRNIRAFVNKFDFEVDVAAMRGYQLHAISCYSGSDKGSCKLKLFEAFTRARQLGGDEARAALVCCHDDPRLIESDVGSVWDIKDRVKVFGRPDLKCLSDRFKDWFDTGVA